MSFFEELKRRKVFRVAASYAVVAFIIMQLVEILYPMFNFPQWTQQFTVIIVLLGFPIAVILSWVFDKTPQGYVKTDATKTKDVGGMNVKLDHRPFYLQKRNLFLAFGVAAGILIGTYGGSAISSNVDTKSIAVLPFDNYSTAPEDQYFSDGVTEMIIANLAKVKDLKVISRTSVMEYKNTTKKIKDIAKELGVAHILEGSIQRVGENVRIVGQLINASSDNHIWAESYDGNISELFSMQNDVAIEIAEAMKSELTTDEKARINDKLTENTVAYEYYLKGNMYDNAGHIESNIRAAIAEYERAVSLDPNFAEAHAQLGKMHAHLKWYRHDLSSTRMEKSKRSIDKAMDLKPNNAIVRMARGMYYYHGFRDYGRALSDFIEARELSPSNSNGYFYAAMIYRRLGDFDKSIEANEKAVEMDPRSTLIVQNLAQTYNAVRKYEKAWPSIDLILSINPNEEALLWVKSIILYNQAKIKNSRQVIEGSDALYNKLNFDYLVRDYNSIEKRLLNNTKDSFANIWAYFPKEYYLGVVSQSKNDNDRAKVFFKSSILHLQSKIDVYPNDPRFYSSLGLIYAKLGDYNNAIDYGLKAIAVLPTSRDALFGPIYEKNLAEIYALSGQKNEALDKIEYLINIPNGFHYGELLINPAFDLIRDMPRFQSVLNKLKPNA